MREEFIPEEKTVNAEFYKGVLDRLLKPIQRVCPAAFRSRDFFLLHDNAPAHKVASVCQFLTPKKLQPFITPIISRFISARLLSAPQVKVLHFADVAEIQEAITDELKKVQKEEFLAAFQKMHDHAKACIYANGAYFEF